MMPSLMACMIPKTVSSRVANGGDAAHQDTLRVCNRHCSRVGLAPVKDRRQRRRKHGMPVDVDETWSKEASLSINNSVVSKYHASSRNQGTNLVSFEDDIVACDQLLALTVEDGNVRDKLLMRVPRALGNTHPIAGTKRRFQRHGEMVCTNVVER